MKQGLSCTVLLSGGIDSAVTARLLIDEGWRVSAAWIDLGQPAARSERLASRAIAREFGIEWREIKVGPVGTPRDGEIPGRNDLLIAVALASAPRASIALGIHAGTPYRDNAPDWLARWNALVDTEYGGATTVLAPLVNMAKGDVFQLAATLRIPLASTYSCESANEPCGACLSCRDRTGVDNA